MVTENIILWHLQHTSFRSQQQKLQWPEKYV